MDTNRTRQKNLVIRLSNDERAELDAVAEHERLTASDIVRMAIRRMYVDRFGEKKAKKGAR